MDYSDLADTVRVEGRRKTWRRNFNGSAINTEVWAVSGTPGTTTFSVAGGALTVNQNTGINEELIFTSIEAFQLPFRVQFTHSMSQRIVNNEVYLEVVNAAGNTYQGMLFEGVTTTQMKSIHMNGGISTPASPTIAVTAGTTSTTPLIREMDCRVDGIDFSDRAADSAASGATRAVKTRTTLDPNENYFIRMRFKNLGTAPATNTITTIETIVVQDISDIPVEVTSGRGNNGANRTLPVILNGISTVTFSSQSVSPSVSATIGTAPTVTKFTGVTNASQSVKATAGKLFGIVALNTGAAATYLNIYNVAAPTVGTTAPVLQFLIPPGATYDFEATFGVNMPTAITMSAVDTSSILSAIAPTVPLIVSAIWI